MRISDQRPVLDLAAVPDEMHLYVVLFHDSCNLVALEAVCQRLRMVILLSVIAFDSCIPRLIDVAVIRMLIKLEELRMECAKLCHPEDAFSVPNPAQLINCRKFPALVIPAVTIRIAFSSAAVPCPLCDGRLSEIRLGYVLERILRGGSKEQYVVAAVKCCLPCLWSRDCRPMTTPTLRPLT